jgi:hypothetical protein
MIRIDEIYNNTFWPWVDKNCPGTRLFYCDPFGHTNPEHLFNLGRDNMVENNYVFMHDQEPVDVDLYDALFRDVLRRNKDLHPRNQPNLNPFGHVIVSEQGEQVEKLCKVYEWTSHYYFFHGWACLDWFRGYDKTFLIPRARHRHPQRTFISPNRIIGGKRDHRVLFLYHVFKNHLEHNYVSAPRVCPQEQVEIVELAHKYCNTYSDIVQVLQQQNLPLLFEGETTQSMTSCWLTNFNESQDSLVYVPTETVYFGRRIHLTEKTFKAIALEMPFVLVAAAGSLEYLRSYGFKTFDGIFDESYDYETNDLRRLEKSTHLLKQLEHLGAKERQQIHKACLPVVEHNYKHFFGGGFAEILWSEMNHMLNTLQKTLT